MRKLYYCIAAMALFGSLVGCKSKQSAYKAAYERALPAEETTGVEEVQEEELVIKTPSAKHDGAAVTTEKVTAVDPSQSSQLKKYSVVIGSFINQTNATALKDAMVDLGFPAILAKNQSGMYRVLVASFDQKAAASQERDVIKAKYAPKFQDAWILENSY